ncbi:tetraacyldisaccharide 4'-kinase [Methylibium sp.]|uniref:tetraacyldisaccharide 4'-kinase n=1 Tax=Methylibium sp. TaxID=2067992 RepID=UPI0025CF2C8F|nr:tetraacyldisaccharide 4'-kinase [Methylibium sp.]
MHRGALASALWPVSLLYRCLVALRRLAYRLRLVRSARLARPVLVVGNRVAGGAGKTPTVIALLAHLQAQGWQPGVVSRGYGRSTHGLVAVTAATPPHAAGDEPLLIHLRSGAPVVVGADRVAAARALLVAHPEVNLLVCDDGLQHLRLQRDVDVVVFDARGAGNGWLLPAGPLREPLAAPSSAATSLLLYNAPAPSTPLPGFVARRCLTGAVALDDWWRGRPATAAGLTALRGRRLYACAGIAQPQAFFALLRAQGLDFEALTLPDHAGLDVLPWPADAADVIVTEKDAVKLETGRVARERPATTVWVAPLNFSPEPAFLAALDAALAPHRGVARVEG